MVFFLVIFFHSVAIPMIFDCFRFLSPTQHDMKHIIYSCITVIAALLSLSSCSHDDPDNPIKPAEERTILLLTYQGHIYDQSGKKIAELPNCEYASEIISDGDDYFVSGKCTKDRVGYWKNGKWNTLHIDFIDDVEHETEGIGKWDYYIFLFDYPNILRNSGIFPLEDCEDFTTTGKCLSVFEGKCYVVGCEFRNNKGGYNDAVVYYEHKGRYAKEILPKPREDVNASAHSIYAHDGHILVGGRVGNEPAIWVDKQLQLLPRTYDISDEDGSAMSIIASVTRNSKHVFAGGYEYDDDMNEVATIWVDGVPKHLVSGQKDLFWSNVEEMICYGDDLYVLTTEIVPKGDSGDFTVNILLWLNDTVIAKFNRIDIVNFAVL